MSAGEEGLTLKGLGVVNKLAAAKAQALEEALEVSIALVGDGAYGVNPFRVAVSQQGINQLAGNATPLRVRVNDYRLNDGDFNKRHAHVHQPSQDKASYLAADLGDKTQVKRSPGVNSDHIPIGDKTPPPADFPVNIQNGVNITAGHTPQI
jgi:hypothetical protein